MGFMDELKKLTQPYEEDEDFFEGASENFRPQTQQPTDSAASAFENTFGAQQPAQPAPASSAKKPLFKGFARSSQQTQQQVSQTVPSFSQDLDEDPYEDDPEAGGGLFGGFSLRRQPRAARASARNAENYGSDSQVILFTPKAFDDARELVAYLQQGRSVVMNLDGMPSDSARRLLDLCSGVALALEGRITPVSAKTYFVTPANVDIVGTMPVDSGADQ